MPRAGSKRVDRPGDRSVCAERSYRFLDYFVAQEADDEWIADFLAFDDRVRAEHLEGWWSGCNEACALELLDGAWMLRESGSALSPTSRISLVEAPRASTAATASGGEALDPGSLRSGSRPPGGHACSPGSASAGWRSRVQSASRRASSPVRSRSLPSGWTRSSRGSRASSSSGASPGRGCTRRRRSAGRRSSWRRSSLWLVPFVAVEALRHLFSGDEPDVSRVGIVLTATSLVVMPCSRRAEAPACGTTLARRRRAAKARRTCSAPSSPAAVLVGLLGNALLGASGGLQPARRPGRRRRGSAGRAGENWRGEGCSAKTSAAPPSTLAVQAESEPLSAAGRRAHQTQDYHGLREEVG